MTTEPKKSRTIIKTKTITIHDNSKSNNNNNNNNNADYDYDDNNKGNITVHTQMNSNNNTGWKIPGPVWGILLGLIINFGRNHFVAWKTNQKQLEHINSILAASTDDVQQMTLTATPPPTTRGSSSSSSSSHTQIRSHFLRDRDRLQSFQNQTIWQECRQAGYRWIDFRDLFSIPELRKTTKHNNNNNSTLWEELIGDIWKDHPFVLSMIDDIDKNNDNDKNEAGFEYWCNILHPQQTLSWHVDKCEYEMATSGTLVTPTMGAVWYGYPHRFSKGNPRSLEIFPFTPMEISDPSLVPNIERFVERIVPHYNRLVFLNVSEWHRVGPSSHNNKNNNNGNLRYTFAVNFWKKKPKSVQMK